MKGRRDLVWCVDRVFLKKILCMCYNDVMFWLLFCFVVINNIVNKSNKINLIDGMKFLILMIKCWFLYYCICIICVWWMWYF